MRWRSALGSGDWWSWRLVVKEACQWTRPSRKRVKRGSVLVVSSFFYLWEEEGVPEVLGEFGEVDFCGSSEVFGANLKKRKKVRPARMRMMRGWGRSFMGEEGEVYPQIKKIFADG
ncbi:MAG: hypothetical protein QNL71_00325 [Akkermansiaceae bacterium]